MWSRCGIYMKSQLSQLKTLLLTNNSHAVQQTTTECSHFSDCHELVLTLVKASIPNVIQDKLLSETVKSLIL